jgi:hypothetical protein
MHTYSSGQLFESSDTGATDDRPAMAIDLQIVENQCVSGDNPPHVRTSLLNEFYFRVQQTHFVRFAIESRWVSVVKLAKFEFFNESLLQTDFIVVASDLITEGCIHDLADIHRTRQGTVTMLLKEEVIEDPSDKRASSTSNKPKLDEDLVDYIGIVEEDKHKRVLYILHNFRVGLALRIMIRYFPPGCFYVLGCRLRRQSGSAKILAEAVSRRAVFSSLSLSSIIIYFPKIRVIPPFLFFFPQAL